MNYIVRITTCLKTVMFISGENAQLDGKVSLQRSVRAVPSDSNPLAVPQDTMLSTPLLKSSHSWHGLVVENTPPLSTSQASRRHRVKYRDSTIIIGP